MNEEYLWSKKGSDPDVQHLENLLHEFRFKSDLPPELPAMNVVTFASVPKRRFAWIFALGATTAAALVATFWFAYPNSADVASRTIDRAPVIEGTGVRDGSIARHTVPDVLVDALQPVERRLDAKPRTLNRRSRMPKNAVITTQKAKLTREEKYAYDRLMLALSLAGSKLKIVQDTIDRTEDTDQKTIRNDK